MFAVLDSDWAIILVVVAIVVFFGGAKIPKLFHSLGSAQAEFKRGLAEGQPSEASTAAPPAPAAPPAVPPPPAAPPAVAPPTAVPQAAQPSGSQPPVTGA